MLERLALAAMMAILAFPAAQAQTATEHVAMGDRDHGAMNATGALAHYEAAIAADPTDYQALWKASREAVDLGEFLSDEGQRKTLYSKAEGYGKRAVSANTDDAEGHFVLARALGRAAQAMGKRDRVKYAGQVRDEALAALALRPEHSGALHVMGVWNAEVLRLSGLERFFAKNLLGGKVFGSANWNDAVTYMERAVEADPDRITHRLDLARVYADIGNVAKAREQLAWIDSAPVHEYNDAHYKREAVKLLESLR
ncbi:MAG: tetratricopeptide repeat protein [Gemmatimonadaceae bacterium]